MAKKKAATKNSKSTASPKAKPKREPELDQMQGAKNEASEPSETSEGRQQPVETERDQKLAPSETRDGNQAAQLGSISVSFEGSKPSAQVMAATSEEFRESLQTLHGALELLISGKVPDVRKSKRFLSIAYREAQYLSNRANDLQLASMIESGRLRLRLTPLDLSALLNEAVERLSPGAADIGLAIELAEIQELPPLRGDEALMRMLLTNLIERCVRTTPEGGKVTIEVELFEDRLVVNVVSRGKAEPQYSPVTLADSKERGLSLYVADRITYAHEGELKLLGENKEVRAASLTLPLQVKGRGRGKILVVDDNPQAATLLEYALENEGYESLKAMNGLEGLKLARTERVDLVILDILLPGIDGFEVCHQLRADPKTASTPVIMVSAKAREEDRATAMRIGADAYFGKPLSMAELMNAIQNLLEENQPEDWSPA